MTAPTIIYAPNVHTGGGYVLLRALLHAWAPGRPLHAFLDARARVQLEGDLDARFAVNWVDARIGSRWKAQCGLAALSTRESVVLCFNGLPPLLSNPGKVIVFEQNRLHFGADPYIRFGAKTAVRLTFERCVAKLFRQRVDRYIVQTMSMARELAQWYGGNGAEKGDAAVDVLPFVAALPGRPDPARAAPAAPEWDFVYVADGVAHKNHLELFAAWSILAGQGFKPRLAVTLGESASDLNREVDRLRTEAGVEIYNLGQMPREDILCLYSRSRALIFPSVSESFGLPLIEAASAGLPILAPELDYVRDVCAPVETFDARSAVSIARAVRRFLGDEEQRLALNEPAALWRLLDQIAESSVSQVEIEDEKGI